MVARLRMFLVELRAVASLVRDILQAREYAYPTQDLPYLCILGSPVFLGSHVLLGTVQALECALGHRPNDAAGSQDMWKPLVLGQYLTLPERRA